MLNSLRKSSYRFLTVLQTMVIGCLVLTQAQAQVPGTGIWMLRGTNHDYSIALVNLTNGRLRTYSDPRDLIVQEGWEYDCLGQDEAKPFVDPVYGWVGVVLEPYESTVWSTYSMGLGGPVGGCAHYWDGKITFLADLTSSSPPGSQWKFDLNFVSDKKSWLYKTGTWAYITPPAGDAWWYEEGWGFNLDSYWPDISYLWTTLYGDGQMRNITLMQPNEDAPLTVTLYSHDNHNIVLAVQETAAIQQTANATYVGYELDWVDNPDDNVPEY